MSDDVIGAVDIGATKVLVGLADRDGRLLPGATTRLDTPDSPEMLIESLATAFGTLGSTPTLISCAAPGPLDAKNGVLLNMHNREWADVPLADALAGRLGVRVLLEDDATAAAVAEALVGAGSTRDPVAYLTVSSGIGAGIVIGGRPLRGAHGLAGEIGHLILDPTGPACGCGRRGDIESYAGGFSLVRRAAELWSEHQPARSSIPAPAPRSADEVFALAERGDPLACSLVDAARHALARAIGALAAVIDPGRVVVGGSIAVARPDWIAAVARDARQWCMAETGRELEVSQAALGGFSALAGAALLGTTKLQR